MSAERVHDDGMTMSFWGHLDVLRGYLLKIIATLGVLFIVAFCFKDVLFDVLFAPSNDDFVTYNVVNRALTRLGLSPMDAFHVELINTGLAGQFVAHMKVAFYAALIFASPFVLYLIFRFIAPALYARERYFAVRIMPGAFGMFMAGVLLSYFVIFPFMFRFLGTYHVSASVDNMITLQSYISTFMVMSMLMGLVFELPILCWLLAKFGLLSSNAMCRYRRHAIVAILVVSAVITPTSDVFTLAVVSLPIYLLYEVSVLIVRRAR